MPWFLVAAVVTPWSGRGGPLCLLPGCRASADYLGLDFLVHAVLCIQASTAKWCVVEWMVCVVAPRFLL